MTMDNKILIVEDEHKLSHVIQEELSNQGYCSDIAIDGFSAETMFSNNVYSLVILDINLPYKSGKVLCKEFRKQNNYISILMLSALGDVHNKVEAFEIGADDYITKPFHFEELLARIKVLLKRNHPFLNKVEELQIGDLYINFSTKTVARGERNIILTAKEFSLLALLCKNRGKVVSKLEILKNVWNIAFDTGTNSIEVYISFLRNKVDKNFEQKLIQTKTGFGYYIK